MIKRVRACVRQRTRQLVRCRLMSLRSEMNTLSVSPERAEPSSHEAWRISQRARRSGTSTCMACCSCIHLLEMWVLECRVHMITDLRIVMLSRDLVTRVPELKAGGLSAPRADGWESI